MSLVPVKIGDKWTVDRDPDEKSYYVADVTDELTSRNTSVSSSATTPIELDLVGVALLDGPQVQQVTVAGVPRTYIVVFLGPVGADMPADSHWTARVNCANNERFDKTTWFNKVQT